MSFKKVFILLVLFVSSSMYSQLSDLHYLPPLKQANTSAVREQVVYLSTPVTATFTVNVYQGTNPVAIASLSLSNGTPVEYALANGFNEVSIVSNANTGIVLDTAGLRFEAPGGEEFYVNYRGSSNNQSTSLTSKGRAAMGRLFKWGGIPNNGSLIQINGLSSTLGIMATQDNTIVDVFGYDPNCEFRAGNDVDGLTDDTYQIELDANESFVFEAVRSATTANEDGWLGATISSNNDIVISNGGMNVSVDLIGNARDSGIDQPVPENRLADEYVFIRGNGSDLGERPILIATEDDTDIFVNGSATPFANLNNGEYVAINGSNYNGATAGANMFVTSSKKVYAYQSIAGDPDLATIGLNFIASVNCLLPDVLDNITNITDIAGTPMSGGVTVVASTSTLDANITVTDGGGAVTLPPSNAVTGSVDWKTFYIPNLTGDVSVQSTGPIAVGFIAVSGVRGVAGYFSGFDTAPDVNLRITGSGCLPTGIFEAEGDSFDTYQWFFNGVAIPGATSSTFGGATQAGEYSLVASKGGCDYSPDSLFGYYCDPDIAIEKTVDTNSVIEGDTVNYTITVQSLGVDPVTNLVVTDIVPAGLSVVSGTPDQGAWSNPNWNIGTINTGELFTIVIQATVDNLPFNSSMTSFTNTVTHTQDQVDNNFTADDLSETINVVNNEITITKIALPPPDGNYNAIGEQILYEIRVTNEGSSTLSSISISDANADPGSIYPASVALLAPSATAIFTAEHTITASDFSAEQVSNSAVGEAVLPNGFVTYDTSDDSNNTVNNDTNADGEPDDITITLLSVTKTVITNRRITYRVKN